MSETTTTWITLSDGKSFSRLLYPNPVCLLGTVNHHHHVVNVNDTTCTSAATAEEDANMNKPQKNVMVLSWLTATNNDGRFVFSICRRRFTAELLQQQQQQQQQKQQFTLSVPVRGMEELVLHVGSISGRVVDKFQRHQSVLDSTTKVEPPGGPTTCIVSSLSRRRKRMLLTEYGVHGLHSEPFDNDDDDDDGNLFAIQATVAQMACEITDTLHADEEHVIYQARVLAARVDANYWDIDKLLFRPMTATAPPYLTFFGSQTFGYVYP